MKPALTKVWPRLGVAGLVVLSTLAWLVSRHYGLVLAYNDAMSHLAIGRRIIDNLQPGLAQIGTIWLPLNHFLYLLLVWNGWAWHTGFAGSAVSMAAYVLGGVAIYKIIRVLTNNLWAAVAGALAYGFNLNLLYLQTTPLTEPVYVALLSGAIYCFIRFVQTDDARYLIGLGFLGFLQVLSRYDGWYMVMAELSLVVLQQFLVHRRSLSEVTGRALLMAAPIAFGIGLWVIWSASFGSLLYFAFGPNSVPEAQHHVLTAGAGLAAKGHLLMAAWMYMHDILDNVGLQISLLSLLGLGYLLVAPRIPLSRSTRLLLLGLLSAPIAFNILALYLGFATMNLPELHLTNDIHNQWFNVRYGIIALPVAAIGIGLLASYRRAIAVALVVAVLLQAAIMQQDGLVTVLDGTRGGSAFTDGDVATVLRDRVKPDDEVLMSFTSFSPVSFASGLDLRQYIHEGVQREWQPALSEPERHAKWVVMANGDAGDPVYDVLDKRHHQAFLSHYSLVYEGLHANVYERNAGELSKATR
jgi:Dolichyl-phosphate-mannose-protein mannosyltransferase